MAGQQEAQRNQLAQQQLLSNKQQMETGALQQQKAQLELADYKTKQAGLDKFLELSVANGKTGSPKEMAGSFYEYAITQRDPQLIMSAQTMMQAANERERFQAYQKSQQTIPAQKAPAPMAGGLGTGTFGLDTIPGMPNALASRAAAPMAATNALVPQAADPVAALETQIAQLRTFNDPLAQAEATRLQKQVDEYNKGQIVPPGSTFVVGRKPVFTALDKAGALTPLARLQNELAALPPGDPRRAEYVSAIRKETQFAPTASTTVNMPVQEKAEQGKRGEMLIEEFKAISASARNAAKNLPALETQERILNEGFKTGFGSGAQKAGASVLAALGVPEAEKYATSAETFNAAANNAVLQKQLEQKGTQSQSDADRMEKTIAQLGNTVESNKFIISIAKAQLKRDIEQRNFYSGWYTNKKTYDGAEDAWFNGEGGKSLFDRPELKAYKASTAAPAVAPAAATQGTGGFKYLGVVPTEGKK